MSSFGPMAGTFRTPEILKSNAMSLRRRLGIAPNERPDMLRLFESLGCCIVADHQIQALVVPDEDLFGAQGMSYFDSVFNRFTMELTETIYSALERRDDEARLVVGHEVGHITLHHMDLYKRAYRPSYAGLPRTPRIKDGWNAEIQAEIFGMAFLAPPAAMPRGRITPRLIRSRFGMPPEAATAWVKIVNERKWGT